MNTDSDNRHGPAPKPPSGTMRWLRKMGRACGYSSGVSAADRSVLRLIGMSVKELHRAAHAEQKRQRSRVQDLRTAAAVRISGHRYDSHLGPLDPPPSVAVAE